MVDTLTTGDRVVCTHGGAEYPGTYITRRDGINVIKLDSGYNIGVPPGSCRYVSTPVPPEPVPAAIAQDPDLPPLAIISTGGTIASRIDYRTGAVTSQFNAEDILRAIPGLEKIARFQSRQLATILSENMHPGIWRELARAVHQEIANGAKGVIVTHGTDTMAYSAAAISFMVETPVPIVFVGSQRSADRPSSDNAVNALCSAAAAISDLGEVAVVMHDTTSDDRCSVHRGTRVRKMHTSRRDAFQSSGVPPIGTVEYPSLEVHLRDFAVRRKSSKLALHDRIEDRCALIQFVPGMDPAVLEACAGLRGVVIAGTGLGHVSGSWIPAITGLVEGGTEVVVTTQCLHGRVCDRVYDTGRDLLRAGVIEGEDLLPETALVKLMWVLGQADDPETIRSLMQTDLRGEINRRSVDGR
ncbi:MAG: Glu-tRNA(Gln) amidotransferase subunit GatD [Methanomicrobiales archaeon]